MTNASEPSYSGHLRIDGGPAETQRWARALGKLLGAGDVVALVGGLGAGKTCFVQGLARGLGVPKEERVASPTFNIVLEHRGRVPLHHVDLYRLGDASELAELGLEQLLGGEGVCAVEWIDRFPELLPADYLELRLAPVAASLRSRTIDVIGRGRRSREIAERWLSRTPSSSPRAPRSARRRG